MAALAAAVTTAVVIVASIFFLRQVMCVDGSIQSDSAEIKQDCQSLINAIDAFFAKTGRPPAKLGDLVPAYLPALPKLRNYSYQIDYQSDGNPARGFFYWLSVHAGLSNCESLNYDGMEHKWRFEEEF